MFRTWRTSERSLRRQIRSLVDKQLGSSRRAEPMGDYLYWADNSKNFPRWKRMKVGSKKEEVLLDVNKEVTSDYIGVQCVKVAESQQHMFAFTMTSTAKELFKLYIRDLNTSMTYEVPMQDGLSVGACEWSKDSSRIMFTTIEEGCLRPTQVWVHSVESRSSECIYTEEDESRLLDLKKSKDGQFLVLTRDSYTSCSAMVSPSDSTDPKFQQLAESSSRFQLEHHKTLGFLSFDSKGISDASSGVRLWRSPCTLLTDSFDVFHSHAVVVGEMGAYAVDLTSWNSTLIIQGEVQLMLNSNYDANAVEFSVSSLLTSDAEYSYEMAADKLVPLTTPLLDFSKQLEVSTCNGLTILHSRDPVGSVVQVYGAYGNRLSLGFNAPFVVAALNGLDVGVAQLAHRKGAQKEKSVEEFLQMSAGMRGPRGLITSSAGAVIAGSAINKRPALFAAACLIHPFLTPSTTLHSADDPLARLERDEWHHSGTVDPLQNVPGEITQWPATYLSASLVDVRAPYQSIAAYADKLRNAGAAKVTLDVEKDVNHGGRGGNYGWIDDEAKHWAFLFKHLT